jgi:hypothetical protein
MATTHQDKPGGKPRQRGRKADQRRARPEQQQNPKPDQRDDDQASAMVASTEASTNGEAAANSEAAALADMPLVGEVLPPAAPSSGATALAVQGPITLQTIVNAYGHYAMKSIEESGSFVEKLLGVRSFDQAIEVQTEFARQAYVNFFAESGRICELYSGLARQIFRPWERFAARVTQAGRQVS